MGLIRAIAGAAGSTLADQYREYFYCEALPNEVLVAKGCKKTKQRKFRANNKGADNVISNGSIIAVNDGQCMIIVDQGKIVEICAEPGEFTWDSSSQASIFYGNLGDSINSSFATFGKRIGFGGLNPTDQRVYFFNTKEIIHNLYGTPAPVPFRVVDNNIGLDVDISIRCNGEFSYHIVDPILFYTNVCGNVAEDYTKDQIDSMLRTELLTALQPAFAQISEMGVRYSALPAHTMELSEILKGILSQKWRELRGIEIKSFGINGVKASEEDEAMIKDLQKTAVYRNTNMAAATLVGAQAEAMKSAAKNEATGPMMAFAGMNMANMAGGMDAKSLFNMGQQQAQQQPVQPQQMTAPINGWTCSCGHADNTGKFCMECGAKRPEDAGWTCSCGGVNTGKFCTECGARKPEGAPLYKCDKCGWEPDDPMNPPKFCPECGDRFDENDIVK